MIATLLPKVLPVLKNLGRNLLGGLAIGTATEGVSQAIKSIAGRKGSGLYLKRGGVIYDITDIVEEMSDEKIGKGLISNLFGFKLRFEDIPILGSLM